MRMSDPGKSRSGDRDGGGRLDLAIARAVREMLDVEPPAGLRGRVLDRLHAKRNRGRRTIGWIAVPLTAAAALIAAVLLQPRTAQRVPQTGAPIAGVKAPARPPLQSAAANPPRNRPARAAEGSATRTPAAAHRRPATSLDRPIVAATMAAEDGADNALPPLEGPRSLVVPELARPGTVPLPSTAPEPMQVRALEITALPETPRERREE